MTVPTVSCTNCGKNFTTDDLRGTSCRYCGTLLAHHARAAQQVAVINQMMADRNGNGIPDAFEGVIANAQVNAMNQAFGMGHNPYGGPGPFGQVGPVPMNPMMGPGPFGPVPMNPMMGPAAVHVHVANQATRTISKVMIFVAIGIGVVTLFIVGATVAMMGLLNGPS